MNERMHSNGSSAASARADQAAPFRLGEWAVHPALNRVALGDTWVQVEPRVMHVLACLASRPGEVFSRERLLAIVWNDLVVCEEALTRTISELRRIFHDDPRTPRFIETIRKGGYRLIAPVSPLIEPAPPARGNLPPVEPGQSRPAGSGAPLAARELIPDASAPARDVRRRPPARLRMVVYAVMVVLTVAAGTLAAQRLRSRTAGPSTLDGVPFTTYPGAERFPALSPDGTQVAFAWNGGQDGRFSIYVKQSNTESPLRLTNGATDDSHPAWSPDGSAIAFIRRDTQGYGIYTVPSIGGVPRRLIPLAAEPRGLDWSPDGAWVAVGDAPAAGRAAGITLLALESLETRRITDPPAHFGGDGLPAFSPDGRSLAFSRVDAAGMSRLYIVATGGGEPRPLTPAQEAISGVDWTADGRAIIFAATSNGSCTLARLALRSGTLTRLITRGAEARCPSLSAASGRLVYEEASQRADVYRVELDAARRPGPPRPLIASTRADADAHFSPDGSRLAFLSDRAGSREVWICDAGGGNARQLTRLGGPCMSTPCWSPDGRRLAFSAADSGGCFMIHVVEAEGGQPHRLPGAGGHEIASLWSRDGQWIYFDAERAGGWDIRRVRPDGRDAATVVAGGRRVMAQSPDGELIYHLAPGDGGIQCSTPGGEPRGTLVDGASAQPWRAIALGPGGAYFTRPSGAGCLLGFCDFQTGRMDSLLQLPPLCGAHLSLSPDGRTLIYDQIDQVAGDLMLVEGLR